MGELDIALLDNGTQKKMKIWMFLDGEFWQNGKVCSALSKHRKKIHKSRALKNKDRRCWETGPVRKCYIFWGCCKSFADDMSLVPLLGSDASKHLRTPRKSDSKCCSNGHDTSSSIGAFTLVPRSFSCKMMHKMELYLIMKCFDML